MLGLWEIGIGNGVEAACGKGMAAREAAESKPGAAECAEAGDGDVGVCGAGGEVLALCGTESVKSRREGGFVEAKEEAEGEAGFGHHGSMA